MIQIILATLYSFYNTLFQPILALGPLASLAFFSASLAALFSAIRWYLLDHEKVDKIQEKINKKQEKMKEARKNNNHEKASEYTKEVFQHNQKFMMLNMKPMIGTMVFVALIFPWLGTTFAPSVSLTQAGNNTLEGNFTYAKQTIPIQVQNNSEPVLIYQDQEARIEESIKTQGARWQFKKLKQKSGGILSSGASGPKAKLNVNFIDLPFSIPILAGNELNWLGFYILIAMPMTFILNKILGIQ